MIILDGFFLPRQPHDLFSSSGRALSLALGFAALMGLTVAPLAWAAGTLSEEQLEFFEKKIRPVLVEKCYKCHGTNEKKIKGGLVLTTREATLRGGDSGPAVVVGDADASPMIEALRYTNEDFQMPPKEKLSARIVADFEYWVLHGAFFPGMSEEVTPSPSKPTGGTYDFTEGRKHWAYQRMGHPEPPSVEKVSWVRDPIDQFILAGLESKAMKPAAPADKRTLIRRASFDLIGLPPTPEEIERFLEDESPEAFATVVDRLLVSPHYGERWGRHWLDVARYADSNGLDENRGYPNAFHYRDYVIQAFNKNKPYDVFVTEQLAGDLLTDPTDDEEHFDRIRATGFLSVGAKVLAEQDREKRAMDIIDEQMDVLSKAFMGQTTGCARCHDHKFDPIPASDYYAMAGIFKSTATMGRRGSNMRAVANEETLENKRRYDESLAEARRVLDGYLAESREPHQRAWRENFSGYLRAATDLQPLASAIEAEEYDESSLQSTPSGGTNKLLFSDGLEGDKKPYVDWEVEVPETGAYRVKLRYSASESSPVALIINGETVKEAAAREVTGVARRRGRQLSPALWFDEGAFEFKKGMNILRLEGADAFPTLDQYAVVSVREHDRYEAEARELARSYGLDPLALEQWATFLRDAERDGNPVFVIWQSFAELHHEKPDKFTQSAKELIERLKSTGGDEEFTAAALTWSVLTGPPPESLTALAMRYHTLVATADLAYQQWEDRQANKSKDEDEESEEVPADPDIVQVRSVLYGSGSPFALGSNLEEVFSEEVRETLAGLRADLKAIQDAAPPAIPMAMSVVEAEEIIDIPIHIRGNHMNLEKEVVPRGFLRLTDAVLDPPVVDADTSGRLALAKWLTDPEHPLTARVMVNRVWQGHYGEGLVRTPSNFGTKGSTPTHPELLDYLARAFIEDDWSIKSLHRKIMLSSAYRMSSNYDASNYAADQNNESLWRMNRRRLDAEPIRDALLAVGDNLDLTMFGRDESFNPQGYVFDEGNVVDKQIFYNAPRRSIYMPIVRNAMYDFFAAFDYSDSSISIGKRPSTVVAPQSLFMMNNPFVVDQAERFAESVLVKDQLKDPERIELAFLTAYGRLPSQSEMNDSASFLADMRENANDVAVGFKSDQTVDPAELYAWKNLCHVLVVSSEFIYVN